MEARCLNRSGVHLHCRLVLYSNCFGIWSLAFRSAPPHQHLLLPHNSFQRLCFYPKTLEVKSSSLPCICTQALNTHTCITTTLKAVEHTALETTHVIYLFEKVSQSVLHAGKVGAGSSESPWWWLHHLIFRTSWHHSAASWWEWQINMNISVITNCDRTEKQNHCREKLVIDPHLKHKTRSQLVWWSASAKFASSSIIWKVIFKLPKEQKNFHLSGASLEKKKKKNQQRDAYVALKSG